MARVEVVISGSKVLPVGTKLGQLQNVDTDSVQDGQSIIYNASTQEFEVGDTGTPLEIQDDGSQVVSNAATLNFKGGGVKADQVGITNEVDVSVTDEYAKDRGIGGAVLIPGGEDLNEYVSQGLYVYSSGTSPLNSPYSGASFLVVHNRGSEDLPVQLYYEIYGTRIWIRSRTGNQAGDPWNNWEQFETVSGAQSKADDAESSANTYTDTQISSLDLSQVSDSTDRKAVKHKEIGIDAARFALLNTEPLEIDPAKGIYQIHSAVLLCRNGVSGGSAGNSPNIYIQMGDTYTGSDRLQSLPLNSVDGFSANNAKQFSIEGGEYDSSVSGLYLSADSDPDDWTSGYQLIINYYVS